MLQIPNIIKGGVLAYISPRIPKTVTTSLMDRRFSEKRIKKKEKEKDNEKMNERKRGKRQRKKEKRNVMSKD